MYTHVYIFRQKKIGLFSRGWLVGFLNDKCGMLHKDRETR